MARREGKRGAYKVLVGKTKGKSPLVISRCRCNDNIRMNLEDVGETAWTSLI
jgi:hypothetical protein